MSNDDWTKGPDNLDDEELVAVNTGTVINKKSEDKKSDANKADPITNETNQAANELSESAEEIAHDAIEKAATDSTDTAANTENDDNSPNQNNDNDDDSLKKKTVNAHVPKTDEDDIVKNPVKNVIIIKKVKKVINAHHGGSWKIAYADFVTAMMTFFLLMWLLSMMNKYQLQGISEYFKTPLRKASVQTDDKDDKKIKNDGEAVTDKLKKEKPPEKTHEESDKKGRADSEKLKQRLVDQVKKNPKLAEYKNALNFKVLSNGLKIELKELKNQPMFSQGKTNFADYGKEILSWLAKELNKYPNRVMIVGHTDSKQYPGPEGYTNWELSADRANATRRELIKHGLKQTQIVRIAGMADTDKLEEAKDSMDPANRRIAIIILSDEAYKKMLEE